MQQIYLDSQLGRRKLSALAGSIELAKHPKMEEIERRSRIIGFFEKHGAKLTKEAFGVSRSTVYEWKKRLKESKGKLIALSPISKAPINRRSKVRCLEVEEFIKGYRNEHPKTGQESIKPALDKYCKLHGKKKISAPTIARIIKELKSRSEIADSLPETRFHGGTGSISFKKRKYRVKLRIKGYKPAVGGDLLQIDSITLFVDGLKRYIITAIDVKTKFAFAYSYESLSSASAYDFMQKLITIAPFNIKRVQTDNGLEFEHLFRDFLQRSKIVHFHNYPRNPQANAYVERFNRTIQEQFVWANECDIEDLNIFNISLMRYLLWYNTERRHQTIKAVPLDYFIDSCFLNKQKSSMLRDCTVS